MVHFTRQINKSLQMKKLLLLLTLGLCFSVCRGQTIDFGDLKSMLNSTKYKTEFLLAIKHWWKMDSVNLAEGIDDITYASKDRVELRHSCRKRRLF